MSRGPFTFWSHWRAASCNILEGIFAIFCIFFLKPSSRFWISLTYFVQWCMTCPIFRLLPLPSRRYVLPFGDFLFDFDIFWSDIICYFGFWSEHCDYSSSRYLFFTSFLFSTYFFVSTNGHAYFKCNGVWNLRWWYSKFHENRRKIWWIEAINYEGFETWLFHCQINNFYLFIYFQLDFMANRRASLNANDPIDLSALRSYLGKTTIFSFIKN